MAEINLHLGCGGQALKGWINIDNFEYEANDSSRSGSHYDIKMDIRALDAAPESVDKILLIHVLEHFVRWEAIDLLAQFYTLLKPGGLLIMEHPDLDGCIKMYLENTATIDTPLGPLNKGFTQFYGNQWDQLDYETHRYVWTKKEMANELNLLGYKIITLDNNAQFHVPERDMRVVATKPIQSSNEVHLGACPDVFGSIYKKKLWGNSGMQNPFYSGRGSHDKHIVFPYIAAVKTFFSSIGIRPSVLDIGCGDFNVGSKLSEYCSNYIACDVVPELIAYNAKKYKKLNVEFKILDLTSQEVPKVDVLLIRQVFQHLSNNDILLALQKISGKCRYLILTEHVPAGDFVSNYDKQTGEGIRATSGSGVVLTDPPFNLQPAAQKTLCTIPLDKTLIQTIAYTMHPDSTYINM